MRKNFKKIFLLIIIFILLSVCVGGGVFFALKYINSNKNDIDSSSYLSVLEDGTYYIPKAKNNITFEISKDVSYRLVDEDDKIVESSIINKGDKYYIKATKKYNEGNVYELEILTGNFKSEALKEAKKVIFKIEKKKKAEYTLSDNVEILDKNNVEIQKEENGNKIKVLENEMSEGQIIIVTDPNNFSDIEAYKIDRIENGVATTSIPELTDIYESLELYEEGKIDFSNIQINEDFEDEIELALKNSYLYKLLVLEVQAEDNIIPKVKITAKNGGLEILAEITVKANGVPFFGIKALSDHDLKIRFKVFLTTEFLTDIKLGKEFNFDLALTQQVETSISLSTENEILRGIENIPDSEYIKSLQDITDRLENSKSDVTEGTFKIGAMELPTNIPMLNVYGDIYWHADFSVNLNMTYNQELSMEEHIGIVMNKDGITPHHNYSNSQVSQDMSVVGKAELKMGVGLDVGISIVNKDIAHAQIGDEFGIYGEILATAKASIKNVAEFKDEFQGNIEAGLYLKGKLDASANFGLFSIESKKDIFEYKVPFIKIEKTISFTEPINEDKTDSENSKSKNTNSKTSVVESAYNGTMQSISIDSGTEITNAYKEYIKSEKYIEDFKTSFDDIVGNIETVKDVGYTIFDVNQNNSPVLIIEAKNEWDSSWRYTLIYTYYNKAVNRIESFYSYGGFRYSRQDKEIACTQFRPNAYTTLYGFYKIENNEFKFSKMAAHDGDFWEEPEKAAENGYFIEYSNGEKREITEEDLIAIDKSLEYFQYSDITKVK